MTIHVRNRFIIIAFIFSTIMVAVIGFLFVRAAVSGMLEPPPVNIPQHSFNVRGEVFTFNFLASLLAICFTGLSAPVLILFIYRHFEKTQSQECVYTVAFLLSCAAESSRLLIPVYDLWITNSALFIAIARCVFFGRLLAPLSFLICALSSGSAQKYQESGKTFVVLVAFCGVFAAVIPVNSLHMVANCNIEIGFSRIIMIFQIILCLITLFSFMMFGKTFSQKDSLFVTLGYLLFFAGYYVLTVADSFFFTILGAVLFIAGMRVYLGIIHRVYMWD
jgi:hypothetical protein